MRYKIVLKNGRIIILSNVYNIYFTGSNVRFTKSGDKLKFCTISLNEIKSIKYNAEEERVKL